MNAGRRNLLKLLGGVAAGAVVTPMPWKLMSDSALWSQNWRWIPPLPSGERTVKHTTCTLCPAGCGVEARCVGGQPVSLVGVASNPLSRGTLCALGVAAHHLPYHPRRAAMPMARDEGGKLRPVTLDAAVAAIQRAIDSRAKGERVVVLDERPGRTLSLVYRRLLGGVEGGVYATPPDRETATLAALERLVGVKRGSLGFDMTRIRAVVSFGAPLLDGWGIPAEVNAARFRSEDQLKIVQVETRQSRTASLADEWLPLKPGTEAAAALGIAHVLVKEGLVPVENLNRAADASEYRALIDEFPLRVASEITGIASETITAAAHLLASNLPAVAIGGGDPGGGPATDAEETAIAGLNLLLGAAGVTGGIASREDPPIPEAWSDWVVAPEMRIDVVPDHSVAVMILGDSPSGDALPWPVIAKKLVPDRNLVVSLSPYIEGPARRAHYILPAPAFLEGYEEVPTPPTSKGAALAVAAPLIGAPEGAVAPAKLMALLGGDDVRLESLIEERVAAVYRGGRGIVVDSGGEKPVKAFDNAGELWKAMVAGAVWTAEPREAKAPLRYEMLGVGMRNRVMAAVYPPSPVDEVFTLTLMPYAWRGASGSAALPPLLTKVYQESLLRGSAHHCRIHPDTAKQCKVRSGDRVALETRRGSSVLRAWVDASVMPGVVEVPAGPQEGLDRSAVLDLFGPDGGCAWRIARARIRRLS